MKTFFWLRKALQCAADVRRILVQHVGLCRREARYYLLRGSAQCLYYRATLRRYLALAKQYRLGMQEALEKAFIVASRKEVRA